MEWNSLKRCCGNNGLNRKKRFYGIKIFVQKKVGTGSCVFT